MGGQVTSSVVGLNVEVFLSCFPDKSFSSFGRSLASRFK